MCIEQKHIFMTLSLLVSKVKVLLFGTNVGKEMLAASALKKSPSLSPKKGGKEDQKRPSTALRKRPPTAKLKAEVSLTDHDTAFGK